MATLPTNLFCYSILPAMSVAQVQGKKKGPVLRRGLEGIPEPEGFERTRGDKGLELAVRGIAIISGLSLRANKPQ
jgi:hypothetical protein